jgi:hypothetical protein
MAKNPKAKSARAAGTRAEWTVAIFMVGDSNLTSAMDRDLVELRSVGSSDDVNVLLSQQMTARSKTNFSFIPPGTVVKPSVPEKVGESEKDSLAERLGDFLNLLLTEKFSAHRYLVILWGHAGGFRFGQLNPRSDDDRLQLREMGKAFAAFSKKRDGKKLEILGFCACALSKAEFALELREEVAFLVSSQIGISTLMTWPFNDILQVIAASPRMSESALAGQIVRSFEDSYEPPPIALTALNLGQSAFLKTQVNDLAVAILDVMSPFKVGDLSRAELLTLQSSQELVPFVQGLAPERQLGFTFSLCVLQAFNQALDAFPYEHEDLVDFFDLCRRLVLQSNLIDEGEPVREKARAVLERGAQPFIAQNARSGPKLVALNGLSIVAPDFKDPDWAKEWQGGSTNGAGAWVWKQTRWPEMTMTLHAFAMALPPELRE